MTSNSFAAPLKSRPYGVIQIHLLLLLLFSALKNDTLSPIVAVLDPDNVSVEWFAARLAARTRPRGAGRRT